MKILVTGGAGFIGSALVRYLVKNQGHEVCNVDALTYSGSLANLREIETSPGYQFHCLDICDSSQLRSVWFDFCPDIVMHLAAESHVDRSIDGPRDFVRTNVMGTFSLLEVAREYSEENPNFRFLHVSTDEVYGSLGAEGLFTETTSYSPNSPYSATKASSDHLARAWFETYDLPVIVTNCSNNYGPYQFPEKLIPLVTLNAIGGREIPIYGDGQQVRDWLFVDDHVTGLLSAVQNGTPGRTYNLGGECELTNMEIVQAILNSVARQSGRQVEDLRSQIKFVDDRPGHDRRYAMDISRAKAELNWYPATKFAKGIDQTVSWYLSNTSWCEQVSDVYNGERLGVLGDKNDG